MPTPKRIAPAINELNTAWTAASEEMYKATQGQPGAQPGDGQQGQAGPQASGAGAENVQDAEFEEVK